MCDEIKNSYMLFLIANIQYFVICILQRSLHFIEAEHILNFVISSISTPYMYIVCYLMM